MKIEPYLEKRAAIYRPLTPVDFLRRAADISPDKIAVIDGSREVSYREFQALVHRLAGAMKVCGVQIMDVVSIVSPNCLEMLAAHYAVLQIGAVLNTVNTRLDADTIAYIFDHAESKLLLVHASCSDLIARATANAGSAVPVVEFGAESGGPQRDGWTGLGDFLSGATPLTDVLVDDEWQPACLSYTSGTTGRPKGVVYHHRGAYLNAIGNVMALRFDDRTRYLWTLPMFHCNGWTHTWSVTAAGGTHVCISKIYVEEIISLLGSSGITHLSCAPVVLHMLVAHPSFSGLPVENSICIATGGAAPSPQLINNLENAGMRLVHLYGLTESYGPATYCRQNVHWSDYSLEQKAEALSRQGVPHVMAGDAYVVDDDCREVSHDASTIGEIVLRGNTLMAGYLKDPEATLAAFAGGVFHTGDLAVRHANGHIEIRDRAKDIIISGGENIASIEVERALQRHPGVYLAAVVAMPDEKWGEVPCAFVEYAANRPSPTEAELIEHCRGLLAGFKVPRKIVESVLPKTATGKIQKNVLRERAAILTR
jgi:fatty-acyl-CoA synthase